MGSPPDDPRVTLLLDLLATGPKTWSELLAAGLSRVVVFRAIDLTTAANMAIFRVGPLLVERLDLDEDDYSWSLTEVPLP